MMVDLTDGLELFPGDRMQSRGLAGYGCCDIPAGDYELRVQTPFLGDLVETIEEAHAVVRVTDGQLTVHDFNLPVFTAEISGRLTGTERGSEAARWLLVRQRGVGIVVRTRTDARGRFRVEVPVGEGQYELLLTDLGEGRPGDGNEPLLLGQAAAGDADVELRIPDR